MIVLTANHIVDIRMNGSQQTRQKMFKARECSHLTSNESGTTSKMCSFKYRIRWFHSKGAALVLLWGMLSSAAFESSFQLSQVFYPGLIEVEIYVWVLRFVPFIVVVFSAPFAGWLADARIGNYRVFKTGAVILFFTAVIVCVCVLVLRNLLTSNNYVFLVSTLIVYGLGNSGSAACLVTSLQLGLDQMPDASVSNITSFIAWFIFCICAGVWFGNASFTLFPCSLDQVSSSHGSSNTDYLQIFSLFPVLCMAIVLCTDFLLSPKWLIIEPKSPQSLKVIFRVLKFAAKHKAPINRSALTYWEEDIPSRIDLGKSKYGGPFTTEQVEDVKTILKLLLISLSFLMILLSSTLLYRDRISVFPAHYNPILSHFTYNRYWCSIIGTLVYEFVIYPFVRNKLPSILKRIGSASFLIIVLSVVSLVLSVVIHFDSTLDDTVWQSVLRVISGLLTVVLLPAIFEFICAQSPYNMRGLITGYVTLVFFSTIILGAMLYISFVNFCTGPYCFIILYSLAVALAVIGFLLHCILARWYKRRVRDDIYNPHRLVEEVYDRYLSAQT